MQLIGTEGGGGVGMELYHCGKNSGKTTWQEAALEVSDGGHPFPSACPVTTARMLHSLHRDSTPIKKAHAFPFTQVKEISLHELGKGHSEGHRRESTFGC